jgi:hypothetical protein
MSLYKYVSAERGIDILGKGLIRFTQPGAFNDPFECRPFVQSLTSELSGTIRFPSFDVEKMCEAAMKDIAEFKRRSPSLPISPKLERTLLKSFKNVFASLPGQPLKSLLNQPSAIRLFRDNLPRGFDVSIGILSLAEQPDTHLMWSHYSREHTGIVIAFNEKHPYFSPSSTRAKSNGPFVFQKVRYSIERPERPVINSFEDFEKSDWYLTKSGEWQYENEWRMIRRLDFAQQVLKLDDGKETRIRGRKASRTWHDIRFLEELLRHEPQKYIYLFQIPPKCIKAIIFGCKISSQDERMIVRLLSRSHYSHVKKYRATMDEQKFKLNVVGWKPRTSPRHT